MNKLTIKEKEALEEIKKFISKNGYSPTIRELGAILNNSSSSTVFSKLKRLKSKGYINYQEGKQRTIIVLKKRLK